MMAIVEDASLARIHSDAAVARQLGSIDVLFELGHARKSKSKRPPRISTRPLDDASDFEIPEEALKGLDVTHSTKSDK